MKYQDHPIASIFPLIAGKELDDLASDIKANGLRQPIILHEDKILDGRNRYRACNMVGVEPRFEHAIGNDVLGLVISLNLKRRHLDESQRAMVAAKLANMRLGDNQFKKGGSANLPTQVSVAQAAELLRVSPRQVTDAKAIFRDAPEEAEAIQSGKKSIHKAKKDIKRKQKAIAQTKAESSITVEARKSLDAVCTLKCCSFEELLSECKPDAVITDPPYPEEFLPLYGQLSKACKGIPLVAVMCGQSYLPRIIADMTQHLKYRWTLAYLTPGGQSAQQWIAKVNTFWKPILLFGESLDWFGDVVSSDVNDNDKEHHHWGQSESGMAKLVERLTKPGQLVCDPFLGGGTTATVCFKLGRKFIGCDIDNDCVRTTRERVAAYL